MSNVGEVCRVQKMVTHQVALPSFDADQAPVCSNSLFHTTAIQATDGSRPGTVHRLTSDLGRPTEAITRRLREVLHEPYKPKDEELTGLVRRVSSLSRVEAKEALAKIWQMTLPTRHNGAANQAAIDELGGVMLLVDYAVARVAGTVTSEDEDEVAMTLLVLENLSCNVQLHNNMALNADLLRFLVFLIRDQKTYTIRANAAKVLVNLTFSNTKLQQAVVSSGVLAQAFGLLKHHDPGLVRQGAWLLSHLTAGQGCAARNEVAAQGDVLKCMKDLLAHSQDTITKSRVCEVVCNLALGDIEPHADLVRAGVVPVLLDVVDPNIERRHGPEVVAPALLALAALAIGGAHTARGLVCEPLMTSHLAGILDYSNLVTRNYDMARVMVASHTLIFALGSFAARNGLGATLAAVDGTSRFSPEVKEVLQESGYVHFGQTLEVLSLRKPIYHETSLGKDLGGLHSFVANAAYQVNFELLPLLRHENARMVINACARLYQIATCLANDAKGRAVLTNTALVSAVVGLLASEHSGVLQAALSLVDALASLPEVVPLLVEQGVMDSVSGLGDRNNQDLGTNDVRSINSFDPLVRLLADRALVTMFLANSRM